MSTPPSAVPRRDVPGRLGLLLVVVAAAAVFTGLQIGRHDLWCVDGYYHIRSAEILRTQGISRSFPWWQETFLRDRWADKDFLYHLLLIPFTFGSLVIGAKVAAVVFATGTLATFHEVARRLRVPWATAFALALMAFSPMLLARLAFPRSFVLAVILALAGTAAIFRGRYRAAAAFAAIYPWAHISYHLLPCIALLHDLHRPREGGRRSFRVTAWTLGGMASGIVLNPFFPNNIRLWWVQNIHVLGGAWGGRAELRLGQELLPPMEGTLLTLNVGIFVTILAALWLLARGTRASPEAATLLLVTSGFLALSFRSVLFLEFAFPFGMLFAGVVARDRLETPQQGAPSAWLRRTVATAIVASSLALGARTAGTMRELAPSKRLPDFSGASAYLRGHVPAGETLFHLDWDEFPQLFFDNPQLRFLVGLDPTFMFATDPARWGLYDDIANGMVTDAYAPIRRDFHCRWVFATEDDEEFLRVARRDPRFLERYRDLAASVFELVDDGDAIARWHVTGYWPDPARRLFDAPLPPNGGGGASPPRGAAADGVEVATGGGFLDLARAVALPEIAADACAVAESEIDAGAGGLATLAIASDDEIRVSVNGEEVFAHSPFRTPRAGLPGGPPLALADLDKIVSETAERDVAVSFRPGSNRIGVQACRAGEDFGFFIRLKSAAAPRVDG